MSTIWLFNQIEKKHTLYGWKHYMKKFCNSLREHAQNLIDSEKKKKMLSLTKEESKPHIKTQNFAVFVEKET